MPGIDRMISSALSSEIKKKLDLEILKKVERELFLDQGMSIKLSIEHFDKFERVLRNNSNLDAKKFKKECIKKIIKIKNNGDRYLITILDLELKNLILELFGEIESRKIISCLLENKYTIPQILEESNIPKTSGYRKIENLIIYGIIIESGKILSESKKISKLQCVLQEIKLDIKKGKIVITGIISKNMFEKSSSMKCIAKLLE